MRKSILFMFMCIGLSSTAFANISDRADAVKATVEGKSDYHAEMAKGLVDLAEEEKAQDEASVARGFMDEAEKHASKAGVK